MALKNAAPRKPWRTPAVASNDIQAPNLFACSASKPNCCTRAGTNQCTNLSPCSKLGAGWTTGTGC